MKALRYLISFFLLLGHFYTVSAQENMVFFERDNHSSLPINLVDSILVPMPYTFQVYLHNEEQPLSINADSVLFNQTLSDTLFIHYDKEDVKILNPHLERFRIENTNGCVFIKTLSKQPFICVASGKSDNGRLVIDNDTTCSLVLAGLSLVSQEGSAIYFRQKQKVTIELSEGTINALADASQYQLADTTDISNAALYSRGTLTICGDGNLNIQGNFCHGIYSSKNITIECGKVNIMGAMKDGIHSDHYKQKGGLVNLQLTQPASKGIKAKKELELKGGRIEGEAVGDLTIKDGETSYCSFLKSDGTFTMSGGSVSLKHQGNGGRCISVDSTMTITGGTLNLECHGDGGRYLTAANDSDYYTPKCITADDSLFIRGGRITCLSTGLGGKGVVSGRYLLIGNETSTDEADRLIINVTTTGECIVNNVEEDHRFGCPKGIKADSTLIICGGNIAVHTSGMGGEGVECNGEMFIRGGTLECITFDDGINVGRSIEIAGGQVYCNSADNDGIDSNGSITISGGIVASVNQKRPNESFDAENGQIFFKGGTVFGIGSAPVYVHQSDVPYYSTPYNTSDEGPQSIGLILTDGKYISLQRGNEVLISLRNENRAFRSFITIMSPSFSERDRLSIAESEQPVSPQQTFFNDKLLLGGTLLNPYQITEIQVQTI